MDSRRSETESDLQELHKLANSCTRQAVKDYLLQNCIELEEELKSLPLAEVKESIVPEGIHYKAIDRFAWDQDSDAVRVYVTCLENLKSHPKDKINFKHTANSLTIAVLDVQGVNYMLKLTALNQNIRSARYTLKSNGFSITMKKSDSKHWETLQAKPGAAKKEERMSKNPQEGLMDMMKDLYENGDDNMKRTISEAWTKARDSKDKH